MDPELSRLSPGERQILQLLAEGHTIKSIAVELGSTETALQERLRGARRKTGLGSSRELARLLRAREDPGNLGRKTELADLAEEEEGPWRRGERTEWPLFLKGSIMVFVASLLGALAAVTLVKSSITSAAPGSPPYVVATHPAMHAETSAGTLLLSVTFSRRMRPDSYSFVMRDPRTFPKCDARPTVSADRKRFTLRCIVEPGRTYEVGFNNARFRNFVGEADGVPATPALLRFTTR